MNLELPDVQAGLRKDRGTRDQIANICWIIEETREFQKNIYFCFTDYTKAIEKNAFESVLMRWVKLEPIIQSEVSQKEKKEKTPIQYTNAYIWNLERW